MQEKFFLFDDERTQEEKLFQEQVIDSLTKRNLSNMGIHLSLKKKVRYVPSKTFQVELGDGWFVTITDNQVESRHTIMTLHGCPGDQRDWAGLETEMKNSCRWINVILPGFDKLDERRGNYKGNQKDVQNLILRLLDKLKIQKVVACGHSMGTFIWTIMLANHPSRISGFVSVAGVVDTWYNGLLGFYNQTVVSNGLNKPGIDIQQLAKDNEFRKKITQQTNQRGKQFGFGSAPFPQLRSSQIFAYTKLLTSVEGNVSNLFWMNRSLAPHLVKVYLFGKTDPIQQHHRTQATMYRRVFGDMRPDNFQPFSRRYKYIRSTLSNLFHQKQPAIILDIQNIQSNFIFHFPDTGHNVHKRRPQQISKILQIYLTFLSQMQRADQLLKSGL